MFNKKIKSTILFTLIVHTVFLLSGCSEQNISEEEYEQLLSQNIQLVSELENIKETDNKKETINTMVTGHFVANVRQLSPDYCLDDFTPTVAVLTCFQDYPFMVHIGEEMASQLVVGKSYYFEIVETEIGEILKTDFDKHFLSINAAFAQYNLKIKNFRTPSENECGIVSTFITYEEITK
ncbi:hypothetical protein JYG23_03120 [Sedimentibacter sp. zth1]|uniref:hypothetical protein n=1 Tax=Sedimentibacter sp. zth1 TaxID=2816908 RepID=UPI001A93626A|nr:hypothetical protein [Sedimentibacter sp. zth1]QSX06464.1 hypothetical protein JYG23_03120 [Sedimentibacter sp. zth1]